LICFLSPLVFTLILLSVKALVLFVLAVFTAEKLFKLAGCDVKHEVVAFFFLKLALSFI